jgi:hypothetical protein
MDADKKAFLGTVRRGTTRNKLIDKYGDKASPLIRWGYANSYILEAHDRMTLSLKGRIALDEAK